jgi:hypothetical protein
MSDTTGLAELANAFRADTKALVELDDRIGRLMRERRRLEMTFDAIAAAVDAALGRGEAPLALIDDLSALDGRLKRLESDLAGEIEGVAKFFFGPAQAL